MFALPLGLCSVALCVRAVNFHKTTDEQPQDTHKKRKTEKNTNALGSAMFLCFRESSKSSTSRGKVHCSSTVRLPKCSVGKTG